MAKVFKCKDIGFDCDAVIHASSEADALEKIAIHARDVHGLANITPDVLSKVKAALRDD
jgi:predicted small metal-binding protein